MWDDAHQRPPQYDRQAKTMLPKTQGRPQPPKRAGGVQEAPEWGDVAVECRERPARRAVARWFDRSGWRRPLPKLAPRERRPEAWPEHTAAALTDDPSRRG